VTETQTPAIPLRGTVIQIPPTQKGKAPSRLQAAVRRGGIIDYVPLKAMIPDYEAALAEATERFPDVPFTCPALAKV
jgi:hypothetical protein